MPFGSAQQAVIAEQSVSSSLEDTVECHAMPCHAVSIMSVLTKRAEQSSAELTQWSQGGRVSDEQC